MLSQKTVCIRRKDISLSFTTHRDSTPATLEPRETLRRGAGLGTDPATSAGREVTLNPVVGVCNLLTVSVHGTVLAVVEGFFLASCVSIVPTHCAEGRRREREGKREINTNYNVTAVVTTPHNSQ